MCIRQTVGEHTLSWAPEWHHYTILGDSAWSDYEVSTDVWLTPGDEAGVMGRLCDVGSGYGIWAKGYYLKLDDQGNCTLVLTQGKRNKRNKSSLPPPTAIEKEWQVLWLPSKVVASARPILIT